VPCQLNMCLLILILTKGRVEVNNNEKPMTVTPALGMPNERDHHVRYYSTLRAFMFVQR